MLGRHWCMTSTRIVLVPKLHCTVSAAAETNYCQAANYILMRPAVTETSTVLLQAGVLVCRQVLLDLEIGASCTTGTKEMLSGYRPRTQKPIFSPSPFPKYFPGRLVLLQSNSDRHGKVNNLWNKGHSCLHSFIRKIYLERLTWLVLRCFRAMVSLNLLARVFGDFFFFANFAKITIHQRRPAGLQPVFS